MAHEGLQPYPYHYNEPSPHTFAHRDTSRAPAHPSFSPAHAPAPDHRQPRYAPAGPDPYAGASQQHAGYGASGHLHSQHHGAAPVADADGDSLLAYNDDDAPTHAHAPGLRAAPDDDASVYSRDSTFSGGEHGAHDLLPPPRRARPARDTVDDFSAFYSDPAPDEGVPAVVVSSPAAEAPEAARPRFVHGQGEGSIGGRAKAAVAAGTNFSRPNFSRPAQPSQLSAQPSPLSSYASTPNLSSSYSSSRLASHPSTPNLSAAAQSGDPHSSSPGSRPPIPPRASAESTKLAVLERNRSQRSQKAPVPALPLAQPSGGLSPAHALQPPPSAPVQPPAAAQDGRLPTRPPSPPRGSPGSVYSAYSFYQLDASPTSPQPGSGQPPGKGPPPGSHPQQPQGARSVSAPHPGAGGAPAKPNLENPTTPEDFLQLGIAHHEANRLPASAAAFRQAATLRGGCGVGMLMWGLALRHGWGVAQDEREGFRWLRRAAELATGELERKIGDREIVKSELIMAIYEVGQCFFQGWGVPKDQKLAVSYYQTAARLGDVDAQQELGFCLANGKGCKKDRKEAAKWYRAAVAQGASDVGLAWIYKSKFR